jgi:tryptophanyl-tRNA synthetase
MECVSLHNRDCRLTVPDEKYLVSKGDQDIPEYEKFSRENARDIIACGFNLERTFIFSDYDFMGHDFYRNITRIAKRISRGQADSTFGFTSSTNIGKVGPISVAGFANPRRSTSQLFRRRHRSRHPSPKYLDPTRKRRARYRALYRVR